MYAIIRTGGKQYRVEKGEFIQIERIDGEAGTPVDFDQVLLRSDGDKLELGMPMVEGVKVSGKIVDQGRASKIIVYKKKPKKRYERKQGHRQLFTRVEITSI